MPKGCNSRTLTTHGVVTGVDHGSRCCIQADATGLAVVAADAATALLLLTRAAGSTAPELSQVLLQQALKRTICSNKSVHNRHTTWSAGLAERMNVGGQHKGADTVMPVGSIGFSAKAGRRHLAVAFAHEFQPAPTWHIRLQLREG